MIKKLRNALVSAAAVASLFVLSAPASSATLTNWYIDPDGGGDSLVLVQDYLDLVGQSFVNNTFSAPTIFTFNEVGRFTTATADGGSLSGGQDLTTALSSYFVGTGSGTTGGALTFNAGGTLDVFSGATNIADFSLLEGSANLDANSTLPNGTISLIFQATLLQPGYFFDSDGTTDLSTMTDVVFGFATTNAINLLTPVSGVLIADYNAAFNPDLVGPVTADGYNSLFISNNGQFRLSTVPEPSMLSLLGIALVGFGFSTRRKDKSTS